MQAGIVGWGVGCGQEGVPGVYTDVSDMMCYIDWATRCVSVCLEFNYEQQALGNEGYLLEKVICHPSTLSSKYSKSVSISLNY